MNVATAHLVGDNTDDLPRILESARAILKDDYQIEHATLQVEQAAARECHEVDW